jgi:hypothetical protein
MNGVLRFLAGEFSVLYFAAVMIILVSSCATGKHLSVQPISDHKEITGVFNVIFYGARHHDDLLTVAILDQADDSYHLIPHEPEFDYSVEKGLTAKEAFDKAIHFISFHHSFSTAEVRRILSDESATIGYELKPLYQPFLYGVGDIIGVDYWLLEDGKVKVMIRFSSAQEEVHYLKGLD